MPQTFQGVHPDIGDKLHPGEDTEAPSGLDQQHRPNDTHPSQGVTQGHADPQQPKHGRSAEATSKSATGQPEKQHAHGDNPPSAVHGQAHERVDDK